MTTYVSANLNGTALYISGTDVASHTSAYNNGYQFV